MATVTVIPSVDELLIWQNAVAFATRGQGELAVGLANSVRKSEDADLAQRAADLIRFCSERGVDANTSLKDVWGRSIGRTVGLLIVALAIPAAAIAAVVALSSEGGSGSTSSSYAEAPVIEPATALESSGDSPAPPEATPEPVVQCASLPSSGDLLTDRRGSLTEGHVLTIKNGTEGDAIVKVRDAITDETLVSFFVREGQSADLDSIPDGTYNFQYAFGKLGEDCNSFAELDSAGQFPGSKALSTEYEGDYVVRGHQSYTLYSMPGGNVHPSTISAEAFNR